MSPAGLILLAALLAAVLAAGRGALSARDLQVPVEYGTIRGAIQAAEDGDRILLAPGIYRGAENRDLDLGGKEVLILGVEGPEVTVIDCEGRGRGFYFHSAEMGTTGIVGVTIRGGLADQGGAILLSGASPKLARCRFAGNRAREGGALAIMECAAPTVTQSSFVGNSASFGGAVACILEGVAPVFHDCELVNNSAMGLGGGILVRDGAEPAVERSLFRGNWAGSGGGALFFLTGSRARILDSLLEGNAAAGGGGAVGCLLETRPVLERCLITGNLAAATGGALSCGTATDVPVLINCLLAGNAAAGGGGALGCLEGASPVLVNCTVAGNHSDSAVHCEGQGGPAIRNSILWGNGPVPPCGVLTSTLTSRDPFFVKPGDYDFSRMVEVELGGSVLILPDFVLERGNYRLRRGSPAVDAGSLQGAPPEDLDGNPRPCGDGVDLGAYELCRGESIFRRGDADGDGVLRVTDAVVILLYLVRGGPEPGCIESADADDGGSVELSDAIAVLGYLFRGRASLPPPGAKCGPDPTPDSLACEHEPACG